MILLLISKTAAVSMCQYFWWTRETCSATQHYTLYCQICLNPNPCRQVMQATLLPLINPPPVCECCSHVRGTDPSLPPGRKSALCDANPPELRAILNNQMFWTDPKRRLPNFEQTTKRYEKARGKIFDGALQDPKSVSKGANDRENERKIQDGQLHAAWERLQEAVTS